MPTNINLSNIDTLFEAHQHGSFVILKVTDASIPQARALANVLNRTRALGQFRHTQNHGGSDMQLTFFKSTLERVTSLLASTSIDMLNADVTMIEKETAKYAADLAETERVNKLSAHELGILLVARSSGKIQVAPSQTIGDLVLKTTLLIPVTHFKTLARLSTYDGKAKTFTVKRGSLDASTRGSLLQLADKLEKSTKKVTVEDIAARRARRGASYSHLSDTKLNELIEEHMFDVFGYDSLENRRMSREAFTGKR